MEKSSTSTADLIYYTATKHLCHQANQWIDLGDTIISQQLN